MIERALVRWYEHARHARGLPWRKKGRHFAYRVWVSETMLQQTRIATVIPYFERFVRAFPTAASLAEAPLERVMSHWSGLGYYRRARLLHAGAQQVVRDHAGKLPDHPDALRRIAGVGAYTAGAIASIAYGRAVPVVDGNVARVLARLYAIEIGRAHV